MSSPNELQTLSQLQDAPLQVHIFRLICREKRYQDSRLGDGVFIISSAIRRGHAAGVLVSGRRTHAIIESSAVESHAMAVGRSGHGLCVDLECEQDGAVSFDLLNVLRHAVFEKDSSHSITGSSSSRWTKVLLCATMSSLQTW